MRSESLTPSTGLALAGHLQQAFGAPCTVTRYYDEPEVRYVHLLHCANVPCRRATSYGTVTLGQPVRVAEPGKAPVAVEVVGACATDWKLFGNVLEHQGPSGPFSTEIVGACSMGASEFSNVIGSIAFNSMDGAPVWPGTLHENIVAEYYPTANCRHCVLGYPFLWGDAVPKPLVIEGRGHHWLQAIPITDAEAQYLRENGYDALENLFVEAQIDVLNLNRACALVERED